MACPLARATIDVEVRGVDDQMRTNVLAYSSFQRYQGSADLSADTIDRLHNRVEREVQSALKPFGYYEPEVHSDVTDLGHGDWKVTIDINPGPPILIDTVDVQVHGPGATDPLFERITSKLPLHPGDRLSHAAYDGIKNDLQRTAATYGYLDSRLTRNELVVDPQQHKASVALELETGERYHFGPTIIEQNAIDDALVRRYLRYGQGEPFDLTQILRTQFALDDAQYFANLEVLPGEPDHEKHIVPVSIHADPNRRNRYSFSGGYATDTGPRGIVTWENRRINRLGHRFTVQIEASQIQRYNLQSRYIVPIGDPAVENLTLQSSVEQRQLADVTARTLSFGPSVTKVDGYFQHVWFLNAMRTTGESAAGTRTDKLIVPTVDLASVPKGYLGEPIFQHGFYAQVRGSHHVLGSNANFLQLHLQAERVFKLSPHWHLLLRDEFGMSLVSQFSQLPAVMRFFAGGDNSVRGFAYNDLSPTEVVCSRDARGNPIVNSSGQCAQPVCARDSKGNPILNPNGQCVAETVKVGGKHLITGTFEVIRDLPGNFGIAAFFDYGNAFDSFGTRLEYSAGIGFRVRLPVVTLGIDVAEALSRSGASPRLHINFSPKL